MLPCQFPVVMYRTAPVNHRTLPWQIKFRINQICWKKNKKESFGTQQHSSFQSKSPRWGSIVFLISQKASSGWPWGRNLHQTVVHTASSVTNCCDVGLQPDWVEHIRAIGCNPLSSGAKYVTDLQRWVRNDSASSPQSNFFSKDSLVYKDDPQR